MKEEDPLYVLKWASWRANKAVTVFMDKYECFDTDFKVMYVRESQKSDCVTIRWKNEDDIVVFRYEDAYNAPEIYVSWANKDCKKVWRVCDCLNPWEHISRVVPDLKKALHRFKK